MQALSGRLSPFLGLPVASSAPCEAPATAPAVIPAQASQHCTAEGHYQSLVAYQEQIYLKSDNHVVHLVKSSAARPRPLRSLGACGVYKERQGGSGCRILGLTQPRGGGDKRLQLRQRGERFWVAEKCLRYIPARGAEPLSQAGVASLEDARLEKIQK